MQKEHDNGATISHSDSSWATNEIVPLQIHNQYYCEFLSRTMALTKAREIYFLRLQDGKIS